MRYAAPARGTVHFYRSRDPHVRRGVPPCIMERPRLSCKGKGASAVRQDGHGAPRRWQDAAAPEASVIHAYRPERGRRNFGCFPDTRHGNQKPNVVIEVIKYFFCLKLFA